MRLFSFCVVCLAIAACTITPPPGETRSELQILEEAFLAEVTQAEPEDVSWLDGKWESQTGWNNTMRLNLAAKICKLSGIYFPGPLEEDLKCFVTNEGLLRIEKFEDGSFEMVCLVKKQEIPGDRIEGCPEWNFSLKDDIKNRKFRWSMKISKKSDEEFSRVGEAPHFRTSYEYLKKK